MVSPDNLPATEFFARLTLFRGAVPAGIETMSYFVRRYPKEPDAIVALGRTLLFAGRLRQALTIVEQALATAPGHEAARRLQSELLLSLGRFGEAWPRPVDLPSERPRRVVVPKGTSTTDALIFGRFIAMLAPDGAIVTSSADAMVTGLLHHIPGVALSETYEASVPALALQTLPAALDIEGDGVARGRFLQPQPALAERWRKSFAALPRPLIGIDWDEYPPGLLLNRIRPIVEGLGTVVGLATDPERHQLAQWPQAIDAGVHIRNAGDLVAAISCLDMVIGTDGLPVHVAGALALPGVAIVPCGAPWYFAAEAGSALWYPSLGVARQTVPGRWDEALAQTSETLRGFVAAVAGSTNRVQ